MQTALGLEMTDKQISQPKLRSDDNNKEMMPRDPPFWFGTPDVYGSNGYLSYPAMASKSGALLAGRTSQVT